MEDRIEQLSLAKFVRSMSGIRSPVFKRDEA